MWWRTAHLIGRKALVFRRIEMGTGFVVVAGATGLQGGAAVDALLEVGISVRALTRDPSSGKAVKLAARGVDVVRGDFEDPTSLAKALAGAAGVFSVQLPPTDDNDPDSEIRTGRHLIDAARTAGIQTVVHTSVARAGDQEDFVDWNQGRWWQNYWTSKAAVNDAVKNAGFRHWTILKPAFMMDNVLPPNAAYLFPNLTRGLIDGALWPQTRLDLIAAQDVGRFAASAFVDPQRFDHLEIPLAADSLTMDEVAAVLSEATGKDIAAQSLSPEDAVAAGHLAGTVQSQEWDNVEGYKVDLERARAHGISLTRFPDWVQQHRSKLQLAV